MSTKHEGEDSAEVKETPLSEKSSVRVGLVISVVIVLGGAVWWAAVIQTKLDLLIDKSKGTEISFTKITDNEMKIKIMELRFTQLEAATAEASKSAQAAALAAQAASVAAAQAAALAAQQHKP